MASSSMRAAGRQELPRVKFFAARAGLARTEMYVRAASNQMLPTGPAPDRSVIKDGEWATPCPDTLPEHRPRRPRASALLARLRCRPPPRQLLHRPRTGYLLLPIHCRFRSQLARHATNLSNLPIAEPKLDVAASGERPLVA